MPFNGSGVFQRVRNWVADATAGIKIRADYHDAEDDGFAAGLTNCITKDGQTVVAQNIPWNSKRITGLADPINPQDAATLASITAKFGSSGTLTGDWSVTGALTVTGMLTANGGLTVNGNETVSGSLQVVGEIGTSANILRFGAVYASSGFIQWNGGGTYSLGGGGTIWHTGNFNPGSYQPALGFTPVQQGGGTYMAGNKLYLGWDGAGIRHQVDNNDTMGYLVRGPNPTIGSAVSNARLAYAGDPAIGTPAQSTMYEPYSGAVASGWQWGFVGGIPVIMAMRFRYMQLFTTGWFTVGYA